MKISNHNKVRSYMHIILASMVLCTIGGVTIFLLNLPSKTILFIIVSLVMIILSVSFMKLKSIMYEDSGEVISIKLFHPLESKIYCPTVEFPARQLKDYGIRKTFQGYIMALTLESLKKKEFRKEFSLQGFGRTQLESLVSSLEHTKQLNLNHI